MCIHQDGAFDVLINGLTAELDGRIDWASAALIIAPAGWEKQRWGKLSNDWVDLALLGFFLTAVKIKSSHLGSSWESIHAENTNTNVTI